MLGQDSSTWMFAAGIVLLTWVLLRRLHRARKQGTRSDSNVVASFEKPSRISEMPRDMTRGQVEMYDFARDMSAEMDTKLRVLQAVVKQADQQAERLEAAIDRAERLGVAECKDTLTEIRRVTSKPILDQGTLPLVDTADPSVPEDFQRRVFAMADQGLSASRIAEQIGSTIGDVEIRLSLRGAG